MEGNRAYKVIAGGEETISVDGLTGKVSNLVLTLVLDDQAKLILYHEVGLGVTEARYVPVQHTGAMPGIPVPAQQHDPVNHPKHYTDHPSGVECIEIVRHMTFCAGNVIKYIWRAGLKAFSDKAREIEELEIQDLKKGAWYLADEIKMREEAFKKKYG